MDKEKIEIGCGSLPVGTLGVAFIVLKLCHVIDWNWFWVLSPLIFGTAVYLFWFIAAMIIIIISAGRR